MPVKHVQTLILILLATVIICLESEVKGPRALYFICNEISFNPLYLRDHFMVIAPNHMTVNMTLNLAQDFPSDPWTEISVFAKNSKDNTYRKLVQYNVNLCLILGKPDDKNQFNKFVRGWISNVLKYGNLPQQCPIKKNNYSFINFRPEKSSIPTLVPLGRYRVEIKSYFRVRSRESIANCTTYVDIK